jgi:hypothetical protein
MAQEKTRYPIPPQAIQKAREFRRGAPDDHNISIYSVKGIGVVVDITETGNVKRVIYAALFSLDRLYVLDD